MSRLCGADWDVKTSLVAFSLLSTDMDMQKYWFHKGFAQNRGAMYDDGRLPPSSSLSSPPPPTHTPPEVHSHSASYTPSLCSLSPSFSLALFPWHRSSLLTSKLSFLKSQGRKKKKSRARALNKTSGVDEADLHIK